MTPPDQTFTDDQLDAFAASNGIDQNAINRGLQGTEDLAVNPWPVLRDAALYGPVGTAVKCFTDKSEASVAAVLMTLLAMLSALIGSRPRTYVGESAHTTRIWALIVGASSRARKGTSADPVIRLKNAIEELIGGAGFAPGPLSSGEGLIYRVRDLAENEQGEVADAGITDKRLLIIEGEFGAALRAMTREGNTLSTTLRSAWDACGSHSVLSPMTKNARIQATDPHIVIVGHITRDELTERLRSSDIYNGLANRLLWVCARRSQLVPLPKRLSDADIDSLAKDFSERVERAKKRDEVSLSDTAKNLWAKTYETLSADRSGPWGAVTSRAEAQTLRLAMLLALIDGNRQILPKHLKAALAIWTYCDESAGYLFGNPNQDPGAAKIISTLANGPKTQTELIHAFNRNLLAKDLHKLLAQLQESGRITSTQKEPEGRGRPTTFWSLTDGFDTLTKNFD